MTRLAPLALVILLGSAAAALAQAACGHERVTVSCPDGQVWNPTAMICTPPLSS